MYGNIVVAYDDSECSRAALLESSHWIKRHGGRAALVYSVFFDAEELVIDPDRSEKRFELARKICYQMQEKVSAELGLKGDLDALIYEGEPHEVLVKVATARHADLIAIGTHGRKGLKKLFLGSVTSRVIVSAPCDVLTVKKPCSNCTGKYASILVSFDGSEFSKKALIRACELAKIDGSEIRVFYVIPRYEEMIEFISSSSIKENLRRDAENIVEKTKTIAAEQGVKIQTEVAEGDEAEKIIEKAKELKSDLIVMGTHGWKSINRAIIGSITERVIIDAPCPVLIVK
ncbi:MAG TPA: universal stress protein [Dissulfurispiraceae bacterium]|nr:universal stress protein [Dissulfurispiraceae bacterium]